MRSVGVGMRQNGEMSPHQHRLLAMIAARPRTLSELADIQGVTPATATALVTTLESRGWVSREHDEHDRRCVVVTVTPAGEEHFASAQAVAEASLASALESLSETQLRELASALGALTKLHATQSERCAQTHRPAAQQDPANEKGTASA